MTTRLYYTNAALRTFDATVVSCDNDGGQVRVTLDRTAFYPTSGGQPFDTGRLGGVDAAEPVNVVEVIDVIDEADGRVVHVVTAPLAPGHTVHGEVDWDRRFDHMQQHSGQHVLSAVFDRVFGVETVSFHMGAEASTIDLAREVSAAEIDRAESDANAVVWENRPVLVRFVSADEARDLPLRRAPARTGTLRLVEIDGVDLSACGGTHVAATGAIGPIAVTGWERFKGGTRLTFVCGGRAVRTHRAARDTVLAATRALSVAPDELATQIERLQQQAKDRDRIIKDLQEDLAEYRVRQLRDAAEVHGETRVVIQTNPAWDASTIKVLAAILTREPGYVVALVGGGQPAPIVVARSAGAAVDSAGVLREAIAALGGRGGGRPELAQGGVAAAAAEIVTFLRQQLLGSVRG